MAFQVVIPLIHSYSATAQALILLVLLVGSYVHRTTRLVIAALALLLLAFKTLVPFVRLLFWAFKGIAWMGFYVHYFQVALGFMVTGATIFLNGVEWLGKELEKNARGERNDEE
ncbi:hypothetical protein CPB83DRAFT_809231 [Crepidotus variabilis]|uniref:Uncharacterized protein n=1 Tax=Crepidotus variabilis TaxID=179855 RepID=A0A9P6EMU9_9AGAR|nr:hypothetical protein CPB83DRAFT_809231 [Crepidotus variabilis]